MAVSVPFPGLIKLGTVGKRVIYVKRALAHAGYGPWTKTFSPIAGPFFMKQIHDLQNKHNLITANYNLETHNALCREHNKNDKTRWAFDSYEVAGLLSLQKTYTIQGVINLYYYWWDWAVQHNQNIHYSQVRPCWPLMRKQKPPKLPLYLDCSDTAGYYFPFLAGSKPFDPIYGYSGYGNTDTLVTQGFPIAESEITKYAQDHIILAFYWSPAHVVAVKTPSLIYSNGQEAAPNTYNTIHYRSDLRQVRAYSVS